MHPELISLSLFMFATSCSPGPNNIVASYSGFNFGVLKTIPHMLGVIFGFTTLVTLTNFGLINIFQKFPIIQEILKYAGSIFLIYLAYKISFSKNNSENSTKNLSVLLEPMLLLIIWGGVVTVALAVILPIYGLIGGLNNPGASQNRPAARPVVREEAPVSKKAEPQKKTHLKISSDINILNVRDIPLGDIIYRARAGEEFEYKSVKDNWYEIILKDGNSGWVLGEYVELTTPLSSPKNEKIIEKKAEEKPSPSQTQDKIAEKERSNPKNSDRKMVKILPTGIGYLNVRKAPSDVVIGTVAPDESFEYEEIREGWYKLLLKDGSTGWVLGKYVTPLE